MQSVRLPSGTCPILSSVSFSHLNCSYSSPQGVLPASIISAAPTEWATTADDSTPHRVCVIILKRRVSMAMPSVERLRASYRWLELEMIPAPSIPLGPQLWQAHASFYNGLTLAADGDPAEREIAVSFDLNKILPKCEELWKRHVCPATTRPEGITFRKNICPAVPLIAQRSYSVLAYLADALDSLSQVRAGNLGRRNRHCRDTIVYAGNALQVMTELQSAACGIPHGLDGMKTLSQELGARIDPFPDWQSNWEAKRKSAANYRNYLTHHGLF